MRRWRMRTAPDGLPAGWSRELEITPLLLNILWRRGLRRREEMDSYLSARLASLTPPAAWPRIPEAADIIARGLLAGKRLAIWGDYDVDGITATAVCMDVLKAHGFTALHHLPDRRKEGYGLNIAGVEDLAAKGCDLLLTVDCGISDADAVARAVELGMTVVISDHHLPPSQLPAAHAIVNPRMDGAWPCVHLAGVGVAFYLMGAVNARLAPCTGHRYKMDDALDLAALGTLADVMQLEGENRILVRGGLARMAGRCRPGIAALKEVGGMDLAAEPDTWQALFRLAPRINAAGRMGDPDLALQLLLARDFSSARPLAQELDGRNTARKGEEKRIYDAALAQAEGLLAGRDLAGLVLYGEDWHSGIVGIVASRIVEKFARPAIILCQDRDMLKGSGRSVPDFDLYKGLTQAPSLDGFGGHRQAAGVRLAPENLDKFREEFHQACLAQLGHEPAAPELLLDGELNLRQAADHDFLRELQLMQPFGPGNEEPVFASPPLLVKKRQYLGRGQEHVLLKVEDTESRITLPAKAWRMGSVLPLNLAGQYVRLAYTPAIDMFTGMPTVNLEVKDWRRA